MRAKCGKVIENSVEYETCKKNAEILDTNLISDFVINAINKYDNIVQKCKKNLYQDPKNPNKEACLCRMKIYYDRY